MIREYAGIGSRDLTPAQREVCVKLGYFLATQGWILHTGNAQGADQAFAEGANLVDPKAVRLFLPWRSYEAAAVRDGNQVFSLEQYSPQQIDVLNEEAAQYHPAWDRLKQGGQKLMMRNGLIIAPTAHLVRHPVAVVLAFPSQKPGGGGTGQGMRLAESYGLPVVDLNTLDQEGLSDLCEQMRNGE
jgi:hypothetical protein